MMCYDLCKNTKTGKLQMFYSFAKQDANWTRQIDTFDKKPLEYLS